MKNPVFKLQTKIGQPVYEVEINIRSEDSMDRNTVSYKHGIFINKLKIVHQTEYKIVLSNPFVTLLDRQKTDKKKENYQHFLEDISVSVKTKDDFWPNGIFGHCYTLEDPNKQISKIKRKMIDQVAKDYGFLRFVDIESVVEKMEIIESI